MKFYIENDLEVYVNYNDDGGGCSTTVSCYLVSIEGCEHWYNFEQYDRDNLDQWINVYANYNPYSGEVIITSILHDDGSKSNDESQEYKPNEEERQYLIEFIEEECQARYGQSCREVCNEYFKEAKIDDYCGF